MSRRKKRREVSYPGKNWMWFVLIIEQSKAIIKHSSQRHLIVWMVEDCPFGNGMCWQIDSLLTLYVLDPISTERIHEPLLSERYSSVSSIPTHFDFITDHIFTHGGPNHWDGWTALHLNKHTTLWRYPMKRHHVQPIQRWTARRMIGVVVQIYPSTCTWMGMHALSRSCRLINGMHGVGPRWVYICTQLHAYGWCYCWIMSHDPQRRVQGYIHRCFRIYSTRGVIWYRWLVKMRGVDLRQCEVPRIQVDAIDCGECDRGVEGEMPPAERRNDNRSGSFPFLE